MTWDSFCASVKKTAEKAADQINYSADLTSLQVKLSLAEQKLEKAYATLGKTAYQHFAGEENTAEAVAKAMLLVEDEKKAVLKLKRKIAALKKQRNAEAETEKKEPADNKKEDAPTEEPQASLPEPMESEQQ